SSSRILLAGLWSHFVPGNEFLRPGKYCLEHGGRQPSGIGVVTAAVVGVEQQEPVPDAMLCGVGKLVVCLPQAERPDERAMTDAAKRQYDLRRGQEFELADEVPVAGIDLTADRLVVRRQALHAVSNAAVDELQRIVGGY